MLLTFNCLAIYLAACLALNLLDSIKSDGDVKGKIWNYDTHGVDVWPKQFNDCAGKSQSPIDIDTSALEYDAELKPFRFIGYDQECTFNITNNGKTVVGNLISNGEQTKLGVEGSTFKSKFELLQFHFHWGYNDYQGSEHQIDGNKFPLELHLVHKSAQSGEFAVLGFFFELSETDNQALNTLVGAVDRARSSKDILSSTFDLSSIIPNEADLASYYRYSGSLTTPPCTEGIIWNVFTTKIPISSRQLSNFRVNNVKMNFREPQKLNGRQVYVSDKSAAQRSDGSETLGNSQPMLRKNALSLVGMLLVTLMFV